jgi:imidazolonepropionase-like amidohydrolase
MKRLTPATLILLSLSLLTPHVFTQTGRTSKSSKSRALVFTHVTVIDATGAPPQPDMNVIITGDRIRMVGRTGKVRIPSNAEVIDGTGKFLIPGLWDMHVHLTYYGEAALPMLVANGVTGVRDMGGDLVGIDRWREEISGGARIGPRIIRGGPFVDGPKKMNTFRSSITNVITNQADARAIVRTLKGRGVDFIKAHSRIPRAAYLALADEARKQGLAFVGHLPPGVTAAEASDAGVKSIEHIESLMEDVMYLEQAERDKRIQGSLNELAGAVGATLYPRFVRNGTWVTPTVITKLKIGGADFQRKFNPVIGALNRAGVGLLAGTDFTFKENGVRPGYELHDELILLVEAGLTPMQALQTATRNPAKFLNKLDSLGTIERGKFADMLLLEANPLVDIRNTRKIAAVVYGGNLILKPGLQIMLDKVEANVKQK